MFFICFIRCLLSKYIFFSNVVIYFVSECRFFNDKYIFLCYKIPFMASRMYQTQNEMPHVGNIVLQQVKRLELSKNALAKKIDISPISISRYVQQPSLHAYILFNISKSLQVNLFDIIAQSPQLNDVPKINTSTEQQLLQRIADLEKELSIYKEIVMGKKV